MLASLLKIRIFEAMRPCFETVNTQINSQPEFMHLLFINKTKKKSYSFSGRRTRLIFSISRSLPPPQQPPLGPAQSPTPG